jgi:CDP-diacylglycerol--glycerol-3-phosphate 3-phosphatidyltransferase
MGQVASENDQTPALKNPSEAQQGPTAPTSSQDVLATVFNIPNQFTIARLILSMVFFALLVLDNYAVLGAYRTLWLNVSIVIFGLAAVTDFLDGYLARKWNMLSSFGRIADPIVDKVFICGSFVLLVKTCSLIAPWIPVVLLTREFLISGLRSFLESSGVAFGAGAGGKLKMIFQSVTVPTVLFYEANFKDSEFWRWAVICLLAVTIVLTISSSLQYILRARSLLLERRPR